MSEIRVWLEGLGLSQYADAFEANGVDLSVLPKLTLDDIRDIGIARVGDRRKILDAIETLRAAPLVPDDKSAPGVRWPPSPSAEPEREAERRQLTVMFCDLVGSTALAEGLDPEDLRSLMAAYQKACGGVVETYDGHVAQYLGDGLMIYFGWPLAHEDDAQRAVRAGLEIIQAIKSIGAPHPLQVRIGIATGPVVVGETGDGDAAVPKAAVGETPNVAARIQALSRPDQVLIGQPTRRLAGGAFNYLDLGEQTLKGVVEPQRVWRVIGESAAEGRFEAQTAGRLTPFLGRDLEVALLLERWNQAKDDEGQVVLLVGEPGIGKSRILNELRERLAGQPHIHLTYQCSPYHANSAFYPIIEHLKRAAGFHRDETVQHKLDKLESVLAGAGDPSITVPLVAAMMSLPNDRYPLLNLSPEQQKAKTIEVLVEQLISLGRTQPILMLFEDAHWADPTSLEAFGEVVARIADLPILLVVTYRPEFQPPWPAGGHVAAHSLTRLPRRLGADMAVRVAGGKALPEEVLEQIVAKTDGVPLFVEELTKTVLEIGLLEEQDDRYVLSAPLPPLAIPATLHDSLMARLDRLSSIKEIAQTAATIGREFSHELLAAVCGIPEDVLSDALDQLLAAELVFRRGLPPKASYIFKHALVQDAAYESLLKSNRQDLHRTVAQAMEAQFPETCESQPELLAHHFTQAGLPESALPYWLAAGRQAVARCAHTEAISHLMAGLDLVHVLPAGSDRSRTEIEYRLALGVPLGTSRGVASPELKDNYQRVRDLCAQLGETRQAFPALWGLWVNAMMSGQIAHSCDLADQVLAISEGYEDTGHLIEAHHAQWTSRLLIGDPATALEHCRRCDELYRADEHHELTYTYGGHDPGACAGNVGALSLWLLGHPDQSVARLDSSITLARGLNHPSTLADAVSMRLFLTTCSRDLSATVATAEELQSLSGSEKLQDYSNLAKAAQGWVLFEQGQHDAALPMVRQSASTLLDQADPWAACLIGLCASVLGRIQAGEEGLELLDRALELYQHNDVHWWKAELLRLRGELLLRHRNEDDGEASLRQAVHAAGQQQVRAIELRAAVDLAGLWRGRGEHGAVRDLLQPIVEWFPRHLDFDDLTRARALVAQVSGG